MAGEFSTANASYPFKCPIEGCGEKFTDGEGVKRHVRAEHEGVRGHKRSRDAVDGSGRATALSPRGVGKKNERKKTKQTEKRRRQNKQEREWEAQLLMHSNSSGLASSWQSAVIPSVVMGGSTVSSGQPGPNPLSGAKLTPNLLTSPAPRPLAVASAEGESSSSDGTKTGSQFERIGVSSGTVGGRFSLNSGLSSRLNQQRKGTARLSLSTPASGSSASAHQSTEDSGKYAETPDGIVSELAANLDNFESYALAASAWHEANSHAAEIGDSGLAPVPLPMGLLPRCESGAKVDPLVQQSVDLLAQADNLLSRMNTLRGELAPSQPRVIRQSLYSSEVAGAKYSGNPRHFGQKEWATLVMCDPNFRFITFYDSADAFGSWSCDCDPEIHRTSGKSSSVRRHILSCPLLEESSLNLDLVECQECGRRYDKSNAPLVGEGAEFVFFCDDCLCKPITSAQATSTEASRSGERRSDSVSDTLDIAVESLGRNSSTLSSLMASRLQTESGSSHSESTESDRF